MIENDREIGYFCAPTIEVDYKCLSEISLQMIRDDPTRIKMMSCERRYVEQEIGPRSGIGDGVASRAIHAGSGNEPESRS
jgi:hypothetical protein